MNQITRIEQLTPEQLDYLFPANKATSQAANTSFIPYEPGDTVIGKVVCVDGVWFQVVHTGTVTNHRINQTWINFLKMAGIGCGALVLGMALIRGLFPPPAPAPAPTVAPVIINNPPPPPPKTCILTATC